jgi:hypothetical protein
MYKVKEGSFFAAPHKLGIALFFLSTLLFLGWTAGATFLFLWARGMASFGGGSEPYTYQQFVVDASLWSPSVYFSTAALSTVRRFPKKTSIFLGATTQFLSLIILLSILPKIKGPTVFPIILLAIVVHSIVWWKYITRREGANIVSWKTD